MTATRRTSRLAVAGVAHRRQPQHGGDVRGQGREGRRRRQRAEPAEAERGDLVLQRDDVEGGLLVRVSGDVGADDAAAQPPREHDLQAQLVDLLVAAGRAGDRVVVPSRPKNVPCPPADHEQCSYSPITPAPEANKALRTRSASSSGTNPTSLSTSAAAGWSGWTASSPSMPATMSAMPPRALSRLVCAAMTATPSRAARSASRPSSVSSESRSSGSKMSG